jgi:2-polyprenyl-3-methyl-5-hydroxy-6-metoxy-1,4-benzoquinol methylase
MTCRICKNQTNNTLYSVEEMMYGTGEKFDYFECSRCKCLQIKNFPQDVSKYYPSDYYSYSQFDETKFNGLYGAFKLMKFKSSLERRGFVNHIFRIAFNEKRYNQLSDFLLRKSLKLLDVGTGNGEFIYPLHLLGYTNILGIDPYRSKNLQYESGLRVEKKSIFELTSKWDIITYNHVFEHLEDPQKELNQIRQLLNPSGICIISIPTSRSYAWHKYRIHWFQIDAPRHFYLHSTQSMQLLADNAGFKIIKINYNSIYTQIYISELNRKGIAMRDRPRIRNFAKIKWKINKFRNTRISNLLNKRNLGDQCVLVLQKIDQPETTINREMPWW